MKKNYTLKERINYFSKKINNKNLSAEERKKAVYRLKQLRKNQNSHVKDNEKMLNKHSNYPKNNPKKNEYSDKDKLKYFGERVNDPNVSDKQRSYAKRMVKKLSGVQDSVSKFKKKKSLTDRVFEKNELMRSKYKPYTIEERNKIYQEGFDYTLAEYERDYKIAKKNKDVDKLNRVLRAARAHIWNTQELHSSVNVSDKDISRWEKRNNQGDLIEMSKSERRKYLAS